MTQVFWAFPEIEVRDKRKRLPNRTKHRKYDHWAMFRDRLAGLTWAQIERKHGIPVIKAPGRNACCIAMHSHAGLHLRPHEIERVFPSSARMAKKAA